MNILIIGSGGREHALIWKIRQSPLCKRIFCAPGNAGVSQLAECLPISPSEIGTLLAAARSNRIDLTIVGPEQPLMDGIVDRFTDEGMAIFGPSRSAAMIEGSKVFAKQFMKKYGIPTAAFETFDIAHRHEAEEFIRATSVPIVVKADGLAGGKGVIVCETKDEGIAALSLMTTQRTFGSAGDRLVIEEFMKGEETSILVLTDGTYWVMLPPSQDHKRIFDSDRGKNTGGMGAYAPATIVSPAIRQKIEETILHPTIDGMRSEGRQFKGCLYIGLMLTDSGPKVVEYNCRFGDPETQAVLPLIESDLLELINEATLGTLRGSSIRLRPESAVCVVLTSGGYPDAYETEKPIRGLDSKFEDGVQVFHAGTKREGSEVLTNGGRVLGITAMDATLGTAIGKTYRAIEKISFDKMHYRTDIGAKGLETLAS